MLVVTCTVFKILLAEDNPGDVLLFREALNQQGLRFNLVVAADGEKAIGLLPDEAGSSGRPDLIVLDVNLPKANGDVVLRHIRRQPWLNSVPVIILTSSSSPADRAVAMDLGATLYLQKSSDLNQLLDFGRVVEAVLSRAGPPGA
jgi:chemotaxis family two-component system response regulator Rcp1